jgi:hypothetical protein
VRSLLPIHARRNCNSKVTHSQNFQLPDLGYRIPRAHAGAATEIREASSPLDWTINGILPRPRQAEVVWELLITMLRRLCGGKERLTRTALLGLAKFPISTLRIARGTRGRISGRGYASDVLDGQFWLKAHLADVRCCDRGEGVLCACYELYRIWCLVSVVWSLGLSLVSLATQAPPWLPLSLGYVRPLPQQAQSNPQSGNCKSALLHSNVA